MQHSVKLEPKIIVLVAQLTTNEPMHNFTDLRLIFFSIE